jgi:predicted HTH domain antitoxin
MCTMLLGIGTQTAKMVHMSVTVKVTVPDGALSVLRVSPEEFVEELKRAAVAKWYELGTVSQSKGAEILGMSRSEFLDVLFRFRVSPYQVDEEDLAPSGAPRG